MTPTQEEIIGRIAKLKSEIKELWTDCATLHAENERLRQDRDELRRFVYEDAPKLAGEVDSAQVAELKKQLAEARHERDEWQDLTIVHAEEAEERTEKAEAEVERLRQALEFIASLESGSRGAHAKFAQAQNRARHALGLGPGELVIKKGGQQS